MLNVYPFASGSLYTASYAVTASYTTNVLSIGYVPTASYAVEGKGPKGFRGKDICLITLDQYFKLIEDPTLAEDCNFPPRDT